MARMSDRAKLIILYAMLAIGLPQFVFGAIGPIFGCLELIALALDDSKNPVIRFLKFRRHENHFDHLWVS
jgi:hypothetical protein